MTAALDFPDRIRLTHRIDREAAIEQMARRLAEAHPSVQRDAALAILRDSNPALRPMTTVAHYLAADYRYLTMRHLHDEFEATVLGEATRCHSHCIAGWALELHGLANSLPYLATGRPIAPVSLAIFGGDFRLAADTVLSASGHTAAAAGHIDYFASDLDGRRQVVALASVEANAMKGASE